MFKRANKITSLLVAGAAVISLVPSTANAASVEETKGEKGEIYNAVAYKDGKFYIGGKPAKKSDAAYYLSNGKYSELDDLDSEDKAEAYGTKYVEVDDGEDYVDLSNGKVDDDKVRENELDAVSVALRTKVKSDNDGRYDETDAKNVHDVTELQKAKFSEGWYSAEYKIKSASSDINGGATEFNVYTDKSGKYIDADYSLGKIKVELSNSKTATVENTSDEDEGVRGSVKDAKVIGQDSNNIYRLATITVKSSKSGVTIKEINGIELTSSTTAYELSSDKTSVSFDVIQVISKSQASKEVGGIKYAKTVASYVISDDEGKKETLLNADDNAFTVADGKLINYNIGSNEIEAQTINLKYKSSSYYIELGRSDKADLKDGDNSVDIDVDGNLWALDEDTIYEFDNDEDFQKAYETDKEYSSLSVYDKDNLIVWDSDDEIYAMIGGEEETSDEEDADTNTNTGNNSNNNNSNNNNTTPTPAPTTPVKTGWVQENGAWSYNNADGTKFKGWLGAGSGPWYYLDSNGVMATGWKLVGSKWYFLNKSTGVMQTGWLNDGGTWYYLNSSGEMLSNTTVGGYKLGPNGAWVK